ncbi:phosphotransferase family protein [Flexivirga oryzae]|uniref:Hygromycin-B 4-O-kinase n=1 Tax=Flexivirga oryzae TaxID=1794944 RepID=A0A839N9Z2_9MICO|nr:phosphotransferase [Flexivirga oryzae]MBB2894047.1 hygromycin-B 4-O-kinase [Flexivirga oryzae]
MELTQATDWLSGHYADVRNVRPVHPGAWSTPYFFEARLDGADRDLVARFGPHLDDFAKDALASGWSSAQLPVPQVHALFRAGDGFGVVSARHPGRFLEELDADDWSRTLPAVFAALDRLRQVPLRTDLPATVTVQPGLDVGLDPGQLGLDTSWHDWLTGLSDDPAERGGGWSAPLAASPTGDRSFHAAMDLLATLSDGLEPPRSFVHSDLINRNVTVAADGTLSAVFDWGCLFAGDYLYDVAWLEFWAPWHPGLSGLDIRGAARAHFGPTDPAVDVFDERMRLCAVHIGLCHLAYNAYVGKPGEIAACDRRLAQYDARAR